MNVTVIRPDGSSKMDWEEFLKMCEKAEGEQLDYKASVDNITHTVREWAAGHFTRAALVANVGDEFTIPEGSPLSIEFGTKCKVVRTYSGSPPGYGFEFERWSLGRMLLEPDLEEALEKGWLVKKE